MGKCSQYDDDDNSKENYSSHAAQDSRKMDIRNKKGSMEKKFSTEKGERYFFSNLKLYFFHKSKTKTYTNLKQERVPAEPKTFASSSFSILLNVSNSFYFYFYYFFFYFFYFC